MVEISTINPDVVEDCGKTPTVFRVGDKEVAVCGRASAGRCLQIRGKKCGAISLGQYEDAIEAEKQATNLIKVRN